MYSLHRIRLIAALLVAFVVMGGPALSQSSGLTLTLTMNPFPSPYPGNWITDPSIGTLTIHNGAAGYIPPPVVIRLTLYKRSPYSRIFQGKSQVLMLPPGPSVERLDNTKFLNVQALDLDRSFRDIAEKTGRLPEGEYIASAVLLDQGLTPLTPEVNSNTFTIAYPPPPMLIYPADDDTIRTDQPVFTWVPSFVPPSGQFSFDVHYALRIVEVIAGQTAEDAMARNAVAVYERSDLSETHVQYLPGLGYPLTKGSTYAWRVQALDKFGYPVSANNGFSKTSSFIYADRPGPTPPPRPSAECLTLRAVSPENGGQWKTLSIPQFSVDLTPAINRWGLLHAQLLVWDAGSARNPDTNFAAARPLVNALLDTNSTLLSLAPQGSGTRLTMDLDTSREGMHFAPALRKKYTWQVILSYDRKQIRSDSLACDKDTVTSAYYAFVYDTTNTKPIAGACKDECSVEEPADKKPSGAAIAAGDSIRAGKFTMVLTRSTGTGAALSGEGLIRIPMINAQVAVSFSSIKVNAAKELIDGEIAGMQGPDSHLDPGIANRLGTAFDLTDEQIKEIDRSASSALHALSGLSGATPLTLPIGLDNDIGGRRLVVGLIGMVFKPKGAYLNVAMSYPLPELGPDFGIGLGARDICFSPDGFGGDGNVSLYLARDIGYDNPRSWSLAFLAPKGEDKGCSVTFDCKGFKQFEVNAQFLFSRSWLRPFPVDDGTSRVKASFRTVVGRGWNFLAAATLDRCEIASAPGWILQAENITIDQSAEENPKDIAFPVGYKGETDKEWTGFSIGRASISLPKELRTFDSTAPPQISANNLIITRTGLTGSFRAENVFMYPKGNFGEWGGSLDTLAVEIMNSSLQRGWMSGKIKTPISETPIRYIATLARPLSGDTTHALAYQFVLTPDSGFSADIWKARVTLSPASSISISNENPARKFIAAASLSGSISVAGDIGGIPKVEFPEVRFQDLKLQSVKPYFRAGTWSFASPEKSLAGFPLSISGIALENTVRNGKDLTGLSFKASVNFSPGTSAISGRTAITLWGEISTRGAQKFSFYGADLDSIIVNADLGPVSIDGSIGMFREDEVYGTGFRGAVHASILKKIAITSTVQFGKVQGFRYFYVDAKGIFNPGIPFGTTGVGFYGLGGGFWWNMKREGGTEATVPTSSAVASEAPGATASGFRFVPSDGSFGFKAMVVLGTHPSPVAFNADVALEIELLRTSTSVELGRISLTGNGYMMADITQRDKAKVTCTADITYNVPTQTLHGVFDAVISATPVTGTGQMVLHVTPDTWYMKLGEPSNRINIQLASWLTTNGYLMMGKGLPPPPPPPQRVLTLLGMPSANRDQRIAAGNGIALGASMAFTTGRQYYFIFYGDVSAGGGFDIALLKQTRCEGVNGWQAQGQLYAYVDASVGLHVDIGFYTYYPCGPWWCAGLCRWCRNGYVGYKGDFEILGIHAAALLEVGGPKPLWVVGTVRGRYSILGGLVKGDCSFRFSKGTECRL